MTLEEFVVAYKKRLDEFKKFFEEHPAFRKARC